MILQSEHERTQAPQSDADLWRTADSSGRIETRVNCPDCCKRPSDKTLCLNVPKGTGICHRCDFRISRGKSPGHFSERYIQALSVQPDYADTEARAQRAVTLATPAPCNHPYLLRKGVQAHGIGVLGELYRDLPGMVRSKGNVLVIPMQNVRGKVLSAQFIAEDGSKSYLKGPKRSGGFYLIEGTARLWICEGFATGASLHETTGDTVAIAFDAGALVHVTGALKQVFPRREIIVLADDDYMTDNNPGITKALAAATAHGVKAAVPDFTGCARGPKDTDFNDLLRVRHG